VNNDNYEKTFNPDIQVSAKITLREKQALLSLARSKGAEGLTGLLRMLAKAKEVGITV
jgi:hypothetical protein